MRIQTSKISTPIILYSIYIALMLYQPAGWGTALAFSTIALTIIACVFTRKLRAVSLFRENILIILFFLTVIIVSLLKSASFSYKLTGQIILFIILSSIDVTDIEYCFLKRVFTLSNVFYALIAIWYCISTGAARYYHGNIIILGVSFDANYLGLSFVASLSMLLYEIMFIRKRIFSVLNIVFYIIIAIAVVQTSSRGSMLAWGLSNCLILLFFIHRKKMNKLKKAIVLIFVLLSMLFFIQYVSVHYTEQWNRMSIISTRADNGRLELWKISGSLWMRSPVWGNGLNAMYRNFRVASHNTYLEVLVDTGLIGTVAFFVFLYIIAIKAFKSDKSMFVVFLGLLTAIAFLDAIDHRVLWIIVTIIEMGARVMSTKNPVNTRQELV